MKRKPTGFIAICQCGVPTGAMDATRTESSDIGRILGRWLSDGCTVQPQFTGSWEAQVKSCQCTVSKEPDQ